MKGGRELRFFAQNQILTFGERFCTERLLPFEETYEDGFRAPSSGILQFQDNYSVK